VYYSRFSQKILSGRIYLLGTFIYWVGLFILGGFIYSGRVYLFWAHLFILGVFICSVRLCTLTPTCQHHPWPPLDLCCSTSATIAFLGTFTSSLHSTLRSNISTSLQKIWLLWNGAQYVPPQNCSLPIINYLSHSSQFCTFCTPTTLSLACLIK